MESKYTSYSSIDLAAEDSFVRWVLHGEQSQAWQMWLDQQPNLRSTIDEARKIVLTLSHQPAAHLTDADKASLWKRIQVSAEKTSVPERKEKTIVLWRWALAAAAALTLIVWINNLTSKEKVYAQAGEQKEFALPEGSEVIINAGSTIAYKNTTFEKDRTLHLDGEAFFKVNPGSTFSVQTSRGTITVLGTSFNVYARDDRFEVSCYTGKVKVETTDNKEQLITAGQKTRDGMAAVSFSANTETPSWTNGRFTFENAHLSAVIDELERQYDVKVNLAPELDTIRYTGVFESQDLDTALQLITWPLHLTATQEGNTITIAR